MTDSEISLEDVTWLVVVDGEIQHEADTKEAAKEWAEENGVEPDRIASKLPLNPPIRL